MAGPPGAGKSRLVSHALGEAAPAPAAWVRATEAAAALPLGAFAALLPAEPPQGNPLGWAAAAIKAPLVVVDDAHLLDSASAALLHHLVVHRRTRVVVTVRTETPAPDAVQALWKDDLLPRLDLSPLTEEETAELLAAALRGPVEPAAVSRLWRASDGNALWLRELVLSGLLACAGGVWRWRGEVTMTPSLREAIAGRIGELTGDEREVLEFLAYGEPLGADLLADLSSEAAVERLEDRALVAVDRDGKRLQVRLAHPLYGEVIRSGCGLLRARGLMRRLADAVAAAGQRRREDVLRVAVWRLDSGAPADPTLLLAGCDRARVTRDLRLAERLARAAVEAGGGAAASLALATVLFYSDRYDESEQVFAAADRLGLSPEQRIDCTVHRAFNLFFGLGRVDDAFALIDGVRPGDPELALGLLGTRASLTAAAGDLPGAETLMRRIVAHDLAHGSRGARAHGVTRAAILLYQARPSECLEQAAATAADIAREPYGLPSLTSSLLDSVAQAQLVLGDLDAAARTADEGLRLGGEFGAWPRVIHQFGAQQARVLRMRGKVREAHDRAREVCASLPERGPLAGPCLGELAHAQALLGDVAGAAETLERADTMALPVGPPYIFPLETARVWSLAARGDLSGAISASLALASATLPCYEAFALHDVVRLGQAGLVAARLDASRAEGPLLATFVRHAHARDGGALVEVGGEFERLGCALYAAEAYAQAAVAHRRAGAARAARAAETRAWQVAQGCQGVRTPALMGLELPDLTPRQREMALLAAQGLSNREIAERLVLSVRTVANTLGAVYERTGARDRRELAELLMGRE
ncbi:LuxR C-terminal-related transcriptional regulator [Nonomuraea sp. NPDC050663]|uniref:helix-turn-helix transcriptional regulator n=1 Tax=Nonomuraea sp. NPDC050663 TaxID=3364370 RepID=UPI00379080FE